MGSKRKKNQSEPNGDDSRSPDNKKRHKGEPQQEDNEGSMHDSYREDSEKYGAEDEDVDQFIIEEDLLGGGDVKDIQKHLKEGLVDTDFYNSLST